LHEWPITGISGAAPKCALTEVWRSLGRKYGRRAGTLLIVGRRWLRLCTRLLFGKGGRRVVMFGGGGGGGGLEACTAICCKCRGKKIRVGY